MAEDSIGLRPHLRVDKLGLRIQQTLDRANCVFASDDEIARILNQTTWTFWNNLKPSEIRKRQADVTRGDHGNLDLMYAYLDELSAQICGY